MAVGAKEAELELAEQDAEAGRQAVATAQAQLEGALESVAQKRDELAHAKEQAQARHVASSASAAARATHQLKELIAKIEAGDATMPPCLAKGDQHTAGRPREGAVPESVLLALRTALQSIEGICP